MFRSASISLIGAYQRYASPRKGYCCAYRACTGGRSCSSYAKHSISRAGLVGGLILLRRRFKACAIAAASAAESDVPSEVEVSVFGQCAPAVHEGRKLCCGSIIGGLQDDDG